MDYFLWALQRVYAKGDDRYLRFLWAKVGVIQDVDDRRRSQYGTWNPFQSEPGSVWKLVPADKVPAGAKTAPLD